MDPEGWMTVRIVKLESELAATVMARKLTEAGFSVSRVNGESVELAVAFLGDSVDKFVKVLVDCLLSDWLCAYIDAQLLQGHAYLNEDEREYVALLTLHGLRTVSIGNRDWRDWNEYIRADLNHVIRRSETGHLSLDGFMRFRAKALLVGAEVGVSEVVEQFLADREYEEFVSLLRYMLESQPATQQVVHVFCTDERLWMCDDTGALITDEDVTQAAHQVSDEGEVNVEDLSMSVLITRSPCRIVIHDTTHDAAWPSFSETLERVFLNRVVRCDGCAACKHIERDDPQENLKQVRLWAMPDQYE